MSRLAKVLRDRREYNRNRRALTHALDNASPAMRDELLVIAQRQDILR
jgi:hypothetical protein